MENTRCYSSSPVLDVNRTIFDPQLLAENTFAVFSHERIEPEQVNSFQRTHFVAIVESVFKIVNVYILETSRFAFDYLYEDEFVSGWIISESLLNEKGIHSLVPAITSVRYEGRVGSITKLPFDWSEVFAINTPFSAPTKEELYQQVVLWLKTNRKRADVRFHGLEDAEFKLQGKRIYEEGKIKKV